jgi:hypothetical protein
LRKKKQESILGPGRVVGDRGAIEGFVSGLEMSMEYFRLLSSLILFVLMLSPQSRGLAQSVPIVCMRAEGETAQVVDSNGNTRIQFLDEKGKVTQHFPETTNKSPGRVGR